MVAAVALTPLVGKMRRDLAAYRDLSLGGVYAWAGFTYNLMGAEYRWARDLAVLPGLLWNPDADPAAAEAGWAAGVFGRAGGEILDVYRLLEQTHAREAARGLLAKPPWIPLDVLRRAQAVLAKARRRADAPGARRRIDLLEQTACRACTERVYRRIGDWDQFL